MFDDLFKFEKQRAGAEVFGFYLAYLLLAIIISALAGFILVPYDPDATFADGVAAGGRIGNTVAVIYCLLVSFAVLYKKRQAEFGPVLIALSSGLAAIVLGGLLGLVPAAYLTTLEAKK